MTRTPAAGVAPRKEEAAPEGGSEAHAETHVRYEMMIVAARFVMLLIRRTIQPGAGRDVNVDASPSPRRDPPTGLTDAARWPCATRARPVRDPSGCGQTCA